MRSLVLQFFQISVWGGAAALGAWAACAVLRRCHAPSRLLCWLWLAVGMRFALPGGIPLTLPRPQGGQLAEAAAAVQAFAQPAAPAALPLSDANAPAAPWYTGLTVWHLLAALWLAGAAVLAGRAVWGYSRLHRSVATAYKTGDGCFGGVPVPFTLGIFRPRIYLPDDLTGPARDAVRLHEQTHIRRGDTVTKPLYYLLACLHWFNPLVWLAFRQFERTMESACDEAAVRGKDPQARALYCESLLRFALQGRMAPGGLAFGQGSVKRRIGHLLRYRRLGAGALALCVAAVAACSTACMMRPTVKEPAAAEPVAAALSKGEAPTPSAAPQAAALTDMAGAFLNPVPGYQYISRYYKSDSHRGDDLCAASGADIVAAADGTVTVAGFHYSYGYYVVLDHGIAADGHSWRSLYAHMLEEPPVADGDTVTAGQIIGQVGSTGNSTGNHCHFELYRDGVLMEPRLFAAYKSGDTAVLTAEKAAEIEEACQERRQEEAQGFALPLAACGAPSAAFEESGHPAADWIAEEGDEVYAVWDGTVVDNGYDATLGYYLLLSHGVDEQGRTLNVLYACLQKPSPLEAGQIVARGQVIGQVGSTGASTGPHLHLEWSVNGEKMDPALYLPLPPE